MDVPKSIETMCGGDPRVALQNEQIGWMLNSQALYAQITSDFKSFIEGFLEGSLKEVPLRRVLGRRLVRALVVTVVLGRALRRVS